MKMPIRHTRNGTPIVIAFGTVKRTVAPVV